MIAPRGAPLSPNHARLDGGGVLCPEMFVGRALHFLQPRNRFERQL